MAVEVESSRITEPLFGYIFPIVMPKIQPDETGWDAMMDWLSDKTRPGVFYLIYFRQLLGLDTEYKGLAISDPHVAFEFKMRWG